MSDIYETLGDYYDALVGDEAAVQDWTDWIESFEPGPRFLELACGSGSITRHLAENHQVDAMDLSQRMLARAKAKDPEGRISFFQGDMQDLGSYGMYDAIGCFCDSFNYLAEQGSVEPFFRQVADHLNPGGLFLFDMHGWSRLEEFEDDYEEAGQFEDGTQVQWIISSADDLIYQDFAFYFPDRTVQEHHLQRVYDPGKITQLLSERFDVLSMTGDFGREPIASAEKVFIACRKKDGSAFKENV